MDNLQLIKSNYQKKYDEIIEYLKQDDGYWLENDKWDIFNNFVYDLNRARGKKYLDFSLFNNENVKLESKFYYLKSLKENLIKPSTVIEKAQAVVTKLSDYINSKKYISIIELQNANLKVFLLNENLTPKTSISYLTQINEIVNFTTNFYDDRDETEKDIWNCRRINGAKFPASGYRNGNFILDFTQIDKYYRKTIKRYLKTLVTKRSFKHCESILTILKYFLNNFYSKGYTNGFLENLNRQDIEDFVFQVENDYKEKNQTYKNQIVAFVKQFLDYIQLSEYDKAPRKDTRLLISSSDFPRREQPMDVINRVKFVPEPILKQIDNNIMELDSLECIPLYILLRETGWRGTDVLNLRYGNCLEQIWNSKEQKYNYYLCGEITKTGIAELKIPIRDKVAEMVEKCIEKAKNQSTEQNNPKMYLFNVYEGKRKCTPLAKLNLVNAIKRLIKEKDIRNINGELYHFNLHSLRHTRAKEYVEQGMGISIIQQILGHRSLQMTVHYATVTENTLYEKWKNTENLDLFRVNTETHRLEQIDLNSDDGENLIRYEYVKKNLDAVRVPFGVCFKASKTLCKQQMNHCLTCGSFCTTTENIPEYEEAIDTAKKQIEISERYGRELWAEKNKAYLELLEKTLERVKEQKIVHKNAGSREDVQ